MSRVVLCVLAAAAALIAGPASADRECFFGSCLTSSAIVPPVHVAGTNDNNATMAGARIARARYWHAHDSFRVVGQYPVAIRHLHVGVPGTIYPDGNVVARYPYLQDDPSWQLCQTERGAGRPRTYECGPYSYHPFGVYGYRPNGTYVQSRGAPQFFLAPSAKIIRIESAN